MALDISTLEAFAALSRAFDLQPGETLYEASERVEATSNVLQHLNASTAVCTAYDAPLTGDDLYAALVDAAAMLS